MIGDIDIYGVFVPAILLLAIAAFAIVLVLQRLARLLPARAGVWHRPLFTLATYALILHVLVVATSFWVS